MHSTDQTISLIQENPYLNYRQLTDEEMDYFVGKLLKKAAKKIAKKKVEKEIRKSNLSPEAAADFRAKADQAIELTTETFRQGVAATPKVLGSFLTGMVKGGPIKALTDSFNVWTTESAKQQADFVERSTAAGFTVTVEGEEVKLVDPDDGFVLVSSKPYVDPSTQSAEKFKQQTIIITVVIILIILMLI